MSENDRTSAAARCHAAGVYPDPQIEAAIARQRQAERDYWAWYYAQHPQPRPVAPLQPDPDALAAAAQRQAQNERRQRELRAEERRRHDARVQERERVAPSAQEVERERSRLLKRLAHTPKRPSIAIALVLWFVAATAVFLLLAAQYGSEEAVPAWVAGSWYAVLAVLIIGSASVARGRAWRYDKLRPRWEERLSTVTLSRGCGYHTCGTCYPDRS